MKVSNTNPTSLMTSDEINNLHGAQEMDQPNPSPVLEHSHVDAGEVIAEGQSLAENDRLWNSEWPGCANTYQWIHD